MYCYVSCFYSSLSIIENSQLTIVVLLSIKTEFNIYKTVCRNKLR